MVPSRILKTLFLLIAWLFVLNAYAQQEAIQWSKDGNAYYLVDQNEIVEYALPANERC